MSSRPTKAELIGRLGNRFRVSQLENQRFDDLAAERLGLNQSDLRCLDVVERLEPANPGRIAAELGLTGGAVTVMVSRLEAAGFVRRDRDRDDRRKVIVALTGPARAALAEIWGPIAADWEAIASRFTVAELETIDRLFEASAGLNARHLERVAKLGVRPPAEPGR